MRSWDEPMKWGGNFVNCYKKFGNNVFKYLVNFVFDHDIAEELTHDVFLKLYEKKYDLDPDSPRTINLIITVAKHTALDHKRKSKVESVKYHEIYLQEAVLNETLYQDLGDYYIDGEIISTLRDTIDSFPEETRELLMDRVYDQKSADTVSRERQMKKYQIRKAETELYSRVRKKLRGYF